MDTGLTEVINIDSTYNNSDSKTIHTNNTDFMDGIELLMNDKKKIVVVII